MAYYGENFTVDGLVCGSISQTGPGSNTYRLLFEREFAELPKIEKINWDAPKVAELHPERRKNPLPEGYGYEVQKIGYDHGTKTYSVDVCPKKQYWGDVTPYQTQVDTLTEEKAALETENAELQEQLAEADELAIALYEAAAAADTETTDTETTGTETTETVSESDTETSEEAEA